MASRQLNQSGGDIVGVTDQKEPKILFSDNFGVSKKALDDYGAFNISLVTDLPLFVDPFLLFNSKDKKYQQLHKDIIRYLRFLKARSVAQDVDKGLLREWYEFREVKENWFGFSAHNNRGRGLGPDFAKALNENLHNVFHDFGDETITRESHLERLCLIKDGVGRDNISDFTVNLIKGFLLEYTQQFARKHIDIKLCREFPIGKVRFNYDTESWERGKYYLPIFNGEFVLLTPKNILTKDENWINKIDFIEEFHQIHNAMSDEGLRSQINNYFRMVLPQKPKAKDKREAAFKTIQQFPILIDYFIKYKEDNGDGAQDASGKKVEFSENLYGKQFTSFVNLLAKHTDFYKKGGTYEETRERLQFFKDVVEKNDGYKFLYVDGQPIKSESDVHILFHFVWYATLSDVNYQPNNTQYPADYKISRGAADKTIVAFKLACSKQLKKNLQNRLEIDKNANDTKKGFHIIIYFTREELDRVNQILKELNLLGDENIMLIDARATNLASKSTPLTKKYSDAQEAIKIKTLGIEIRGNYIFKGSQKCKINDTDKCLIYFLYFKFVSNKDECFQLTRLISEIEPDIGKKSEGYIKNRIVHINKAVRELIIKGKTSIGAFIKCEQGRGYHLNPKIVI